MLALDIIKKGQERFSLWKRNVHPFIEEYEQFFAKIAGSNIVKKFGQYDAERVAY